MKCVYEKQLMAPWHEGHFEIVLSKFEMIYSVVLLRMSIRILNVSKNTSPTLLYTVKQDGLIAPDSGNDFDKLCNIGGVWNQPFPHRSTDRECCY